MMSMRKLKNTSIPPQLLQKMDQQNILEEYFRRGYGVPKRTRNVRNKAVKNFIKQKYMDGYASGLHKTPKEVENEMMNATMEDGQPRFHYTDILEEEQIKAMFSNTYGKQKRGKKPIDGDNDDDHQIDAPTGYEDFSEEYENTLATELAKEDISNNVLEQLEKENKASNQSRGRAGTKKKVTKRTQAKRSSSLGETSKVSIN